MVRASDNDDACSKVRCSTYWKETRTLWREYIFKKVSMEQAVWASLVSGRAVIYWS